MSSIKILKTVAVYRTNPDEAVVVVQLWSGFLGGRQGVVVSHNGTVSSKLSGRPTAMADRYRLLTADLDVNAVAVTESEARAHLLRITGIGPAACASCQATLPINGLWCPSCAAPQIQPALAPASTHPRPDTQE